MKSFFKYMLIAAASLACICSLAFISTFTYFYFTEIVESNDVENTDYIIEQCINEYEKGNNVELLNSYFYFYYYPNTAIISNEHFRKIIDYNFFSSNYNNSLLKEFEDEDTMNLEEEYNNAVKMYFWSLLSNDDFETFSKDFKELYPLTIEHKSKLVEGNDIEYLYGYYLSEVIETEEEAMVFLQGCVDLHNSINDDNEKYNIVEFLYHYAKLVGNKEIETQYKQKLVDLQEALLYKKDNASSTNKK